MLEEAASSTHFKSVTAGAHICTGRRGWHPLTPACRKPVKHPRWLVACFWMDGHCASIWCRGKGGKSGKG
jgi:hypothetical protein